MFVFRTTQPLTLFQIMRTRGVAWGALRRGASRGWAVLSERGYSSRQRHAGAVGVRGALRGDDARGRRGGGTWCSAPSASPTRRHSPSLCNGVTLLRVTSHRTVCVYSTTQVDEPGVK